LAKGGFSLCDTEGLAWHFGFSSSGMQVGAAAQSLAFQCENPRPGLSWLCLAMILLDALFTIFRVKT
jgi:hypothetical protein